MSVLSDRQISVAAREDNMIVPFLDYEAQAAWKKQMRGSTISAGLTSYGYDARLAPDVQLLESCGGAEIDPKSFNPYLLHPLKADPVTRAVTLPPHSFVLAHTIETFKIPRNVLVVCVGKSTYARCGLIVNVTPLEPDWEGQVTLEISNTTPVPAKIYIEEGICQMIFHQSADVERTLHNMGHIRDHFTYGGCIRSYADKQGRYMGQEGIVTPTPDAPVTANG